MYVIGWCMSEIIAFYKITIDSCKFMQLAVFANNVVRMVLTDIQTWCCWNW